MINYLTIEKVIEEYKKLPREAIAVLSSEEEATSGKKLVDFYRLSGDETKDFSRFYLSILFKINKPDDIFYFIKEKIKFKSPEFSKQFIIDFASGLYNYGDFIPDAKSFCQKVGVNISARRPLIEIIEIKKDEENMEDNFEDKKTEVEIIKISLSQAIQKYPQLGEQLVTSSPIKLRIFPQPVRPSIKNWIEDYRSMMGAQRHGMMERGNYVFHSENTKKLNAGDRKKLAEVLRSLDEDVALKVDPDRQEVVFEVFEEKKPVEKMPNFQPELPAENFPVANQVSSAQSSPRFGEASGINYARQNQNNKVFERPLPRRESVVSQNIPNSAIQEKNRDNFFGNYQQKMEPVKPEMQKPSYQTPVQPSQNMGNNRNENYVVKTEQLKRSSVPIRPSLAGKSYEEINNDPKIRGNVVDLKN
ncbi:MAG: hypothetical protein WC906_03980 [Parcubacteria group bacterium]|jgi:hypothetical protein